MSTTTSNFKFIKPDLSDAADRTATNKNWDTLDSKLKVMDDTSSGINTKVTSLEQEQQKTVGLDKGGTGATTADEARKNLGALKQPSYINSILYTNAWVESNGRYTKDVGYAGRLVELLPSPTMNEAQLEAFSAAKLVGDPSSEQNIVYVMGEKPTIDLPIILGVY